jgi:GR25 family glycosyltransferase involved in LPS biosynthesis
MKGFYINLDSRKDRRDHFEDMKKQYPFLSNIERFSAIENADGPLGCCMSHIQSMTLLNNCHEPYVAIFEDDFTILNHDVFLQFIQDFNLIKDSDAWKVIVLTPRGTTITDSVNLPNFRKIVDHQTATGYIVKKDMLTVLIDTLKEAAQLQIQGVEKDISANDQYWKRIQKTYPFYYYKDVFAGQLIGWSNIENRFVDYNDRFMKQYLF